MITKLIACTLSPFSRVWRIIFFNQCPSKWTRAGGVPIMYFYIFCCIRSAHLFAFRECERNTSHSHRCIILLLLLFVRCEFIHKMHTENLIKTFFQKLANRCEIIEYMCMTAGRPAIPSDIKVELSMWQWVTYTQLEQMYPRLAVDLVAMFRCRRQLIARPHVNFVYIHIYVSLYTLHTDRINFICSFSFLLLVLVIEFEFGFYCVHYTHNADKLINNSIVANVHT